MSISEHGAPTQAEINVLMISRAMPGGYFFEGGANEAEVRVACRRLVMREFGQLFVGEKGESFRTTSKGAAFLADHLAKGAAR